PVHRKIGNGNRVRRLFSNRTVVSPHLKRAAGNLDELRFNRRFRLAWTARSRRLDRRAWPKDEKSPDAPSDQKQNTQPEHYRPAGFSLSHQADLGSCRKAAF